MLAGIYHWLEQRETLRVERIAHHYFYPRGSTMARFPLMPFDPERYPENHAKLQAVLVAEKAAGRYEQWDRITPEPFHHLQEPLI